jgi:hypothetical protein
MSNTSDNSTYNKLAVQCLNEALCLVSNSVLVESLVLRNRQLMIGHDHKSIYQHTLISYQISKTVSNDLFVLIWF